eukprot:s2752_g2.t1
MAAAAPVAMEEEPQCTEAEMPQEAPSSEKQEQVDPVEHDAFMFPFALKASDLRTEESSDEEDEDTDGPADQGMLSSVYQAKMFSDPEEYEKWKARGWRAVQCCGGALLVLALIFDEMD